MNKLIAAVLLTGLPFAALAEGSAVMVHDGYARAANPRSGAAFMTLVNSGAVDCTLVSAQTTVSEKTELHTNKEVDGVMKMLPADPIIVPAGGKAVLARGGDHVMLMGLVKPLANGDQVALTLDLGDCGTIQTVLPVDNDRKPQAGGASHGH